MVRILHILAAVGVPGGVQEVVWNYYKYINEDEIRFDFAVTGTKMTGFEQNFLNKKSKIHYMVPKKKNIFKHCSQLYKVLKREKYDIVHVHQDYLSCVALFVAWLCGVKVRIVHSHKANMRTSLKKQMMISILKFLTKLFATDFFACGVEAATWTYGKRLYDDDNVYIMSNAVDAKKFEYNENARIAVREEYAFDNKIVIGNVARFSYQKNHELLIDIFEKLYKKNNNYRLVLVGNGENFEKITRITKEKGLDEAVIMLGARKDVNVLLNAFDIFVLTSRWEGLPVTLVEAQFNGLPCVVSSTTTKEINVSNNVLYIDNDHDIEEWTRKIENSCVEKRRKIVLDLKNSGYGIESEVEKLVSKYRQLLRESTVHKKCLNIH